MQTLLVWAQTSQLAPLHNIPTAGENLNFSLQDSGGETTVKIANLKLFTGLSTSSFIIPYVFHLSIFIVRTRQGLTTH